MPEFSNYVEGLTAVVGALSGDEIVPVSKDGDAASVTTQQIANMAGAGSVASVTGTSVDNTDTANPVVNAVPTTLAGDTTILSGGFYLRVQGVGLEEPQIILDAPNNVRKSLTYRTGNLDRWQVHIENNETGVANAGSDFHIERYDDAGSQIDAPFGINRTDGVAFFNKAPVITTAPAAAANNTEVPTTAWVKTETVGVQDLFIPASAMWPRVTGGCGVLTQYEMATSLFNVQGLPFDQTTQEFAQFQIRLPRKYNNGTITVAPYWTAQAGAGTVQWGISGGAYSNDDALTVALGTPQTSDDTLIATNDLHIGPTTAAITLAGTPADADFLAIQVSRNVASDTLTGDAILLGIVVFITTDAAVDN